MAMADRIAVMNDEPIHQLGAPSEIYDRPGHAVRGGLHRRHEPPGGQAEHDGERRTVVLGERIPLPIGRVVEDAPDGGRARAGLRPDDIRVNAREEGVAASLVASMVLGHEVQTVARLETGDEIIARQSRAEEDGVAALAPGDRIWLEWPEQAPLLLGAGTATDTTSPVLLQP